MTFPRSDAASAPPRAIGAPSRKGYYDEAATWSADINASLRASRRVAWTVAAAACLVAVLEALALVALTPLKTVVPDIITVDRQTGYVQEVNGLRAGPLTQDQAVTQAFLVQYVIARETFDATDLRDDYHKVMLWSAGDARAQYQTLMQRTTPNSPLALYSPTTPRSPSPSTASRCCRRPPPWCGSRPPATRLNPAPLRSSRGAAVPGLPIHPGADEQW